MSGPTNDLMDLAAPYALHAVSSEEAAQIERELAAMPRPVAQEFHADVRAIRETMAVVSAHTAAEPPEQLRDRLLKSVRTTNVRELRPRTPRWRTAALSAAAALAIGLGAVGAVLALRPEPAPSTAGEVFAAPDVRTVFGDIPSGGTATLVFSRDRNAAVLVMNNVAPPEPGSVYQMWLIDADGPHSAGTMDAQAVSPSTTAVLPDLGTSTALTFTVEPGTGSSEPTGPLVAELPLS